jgi:DNA-3-methyladenine glycosylase II
MTPKKVATARPAARRATAARPDVAARDGDAAVRSLARRDRRLAALIRRIGPYRPARTANPFLALVGSILHQQVSMSAAAAVYRRLKALCPRGRMTPAAVLTIGDDALRAAGLSRQKVQYVRGLAQAFASGELTATKLRRMSDDEVIEATTRLKGVGRWTAEMLLLFCLGRPDVWPSDDLGLRRAAQLFLQRDEPPTAAALRALGEPWRPYRSYATWYLWRSLDKPLQPAITP